MVTFSCRTAGLFLLCFACRESSVQGQQVLKERRMVAHGSGLFPHWQAQFSLWHVWNASSMSRQLLPAHPSFLVGDRHADPGVDFGVVQWVTIP